MSIISFPKLHGCIDNCIRCILTSKSGNYCIQQNSLCYQRSQRCIQYFVEMTESKMEMSLCGSPSIRTSLLHNYFTSLLDLLVFEGRKIDPTHLNISFHGLYKYCYNYRLAASEIVPFTPEWSILAVPDQKEVRKTFPFP